MLQRKDILEHFRRRPRPQSFRELVGAFGLQRAEARRLRRLLRQMLREGELVYTRKGLYAPAEEVNLVRGSFEAHAEGYGFVIPETPGQRDIFIPPHATMGAMDGDRVIARPEPPGRKGRVLRILERALHRVVGTLERANRAWFVKPSSRRMAFDIYIPSKELSGAKAGQRVLVELTEYPEGRRPPVGKVLKVLKEPQSPLEEIEAIMEEFNLPKRFPAEAQREARGLSEATPKGRKDLRRLPTVTIDGEQAKDFDDAISIRLTDIGFRLWVHIADVSHYVPEEGALDREAFKRGCSVYFPDRVVPMLPKRLSEDLCSLRPHRPRAAFTVEMDFDRYGKRYRAAFYPSLIMSDERMTYTSVKKILADEDPKERKRYEHLLREFELMAELASELRQRRLQRGSLDFDLPEPEVLLDLQGRPEAILRAERNLAHIIIEEFMIAANEAVAEHLERLGLPTLYRVHEPPEEEKLREIFRLGKVLFGRRIQSLQELLAAARGTPKEDVVNHLVLRSLKQARYSPLNIGHFGLASECYTHFTSPIRRYPDLVVHRVLRKALSPRGPSEKGLKALAERLSDIAFHTSRMERLSDEVERATLRAMRVWFMREKVGEAFRGKVIGITPYGLRIRLEEFYVEGFLHVSSLTDDFYVYNEQTLMLVGRATGKRFRIGDMLTVRVERVDMLEKEILLGLL